MNGGDTKRSIVLMRSSTANSLLKATSSSYLWIADQVSGLCSRTCVSFRIRFSGFWSNQLSGIDDSENSLLGLTYPARVLIWEIVKV